MASFAAVAVVAGMGVVILGQRAPASAAVVGCGRADIYARHTVVPADAVGGGSVSGAKFGAAVATGDFNKDGFTDVAVGAPKDAVNGVASGSVSVFPGSATGVGTGKRLRQADAGAADEAGDQWGTALAAGDFNKDGFTDLAIGAPGEDVGTATDTGGISVFLGSSAGLTTGRSLGQELIGAVESGDLFGTALAAGDFDGDGFGDLAIGAPGEIPGGETLRGGAVYVYRGSASGFVAGWAKIQENAGANNTETGDQFGAALAAGNVTGDSRADLVVGAPGEAPGSDSSAVKAGAIYVFPGSSSGSAAGFGRMQENATGAASEANDRFGAALAIGNFDKDGFADIAVGVPGENPGSAAASGSVVIFPGASSALGQGFRVQENQGGEVAAAGDTFGAALATGDANGDGHADLLVGAPGKSYGTTTATGAAFLFSGGVRDSGSTVSVRVGRRIVQPDVLWGNGNNNNFGSGLAFGDVTGDGKQEAVIGGSGEVPSGQPASGAAVVLHNLAPQAAQQVALDTLAPTAATQASPVPGASVATLEYAYTNGIGRLWHGHQTDPSNFSSVVWTPISQDLEAYTGTPSLVEQADGRLQIAAHNTTSNVWVNTLATKEPAIWGNWLNAEGQMASHTAAVRQADGTVVVFSIDRNGVLWALHQTGQNAAHTAWLSLGVAGLTGTPSAVRAGNGIRIFARDTAGDIKTMMYADRLVSNCTGLGGSGLTGTPSAIALPGGTLLAFARAADGSIVSQRSDPAGVFPGAWTAVGSLASAGSPSVVLNPATDRIMIVARGNDGIVYAADETGQGTGQWRDWVSAIPDTDPRRAATDPTAFTFNSANGPTMAFVIRTSDQTNWIYDFDNRLFSGSATLNGGEEPQPPAFVGHALPVPPEE